jgi:hypothetical protein
MMPSPYRAPMMAAVSKPSGCGAGAWAGEGARSVLMRVSRWDAVARGGAAAVAGLLDKP